MSRPLRIEYPGAWYHVMNRGRWSEQLFFSDSAYLDFVSLEDSQEIEKFYSLKNMPSILGGTSFKKYIKEKFYELTNIPEISESKVLAQDAEKVILSDCDYYRVSKSDLLISKRGTENLPRDIASYLVRRLCRLTLPRVARS